MQEIGNVCFARSSTAIKQPHKEIKEYTEKGPNGTLFSPCAVCGSVFCFVDPDKDNKAKSLEDQNNLQMQIENQVNEPAASAIPEQLPLTGLEKLAQAKAKKKE